MNLARDRTDSPIRYGRHNVVIIIGLILIASRSDAIQNDSLARMSTESRYRLFGLQADGAIFFFAGSGSLSFDFDVWDEREKSSVALVGLRLEREWIGYSDPGGKNVSFREYNILARATHITGSVRADAGIGASFRTKGSDSHTTVLAMMNLKWLFILDHAGMLFTVRVYPFDDKTTLKWFLGIGLAVALDF